MVKTAPWGPSVEEAWKQELADSSLGWGRKGPCRVEIESHQRNARKCQQRAKAERPRVRRR